MSREKELTEGEKRFIAQLTGDNPVLVQWVKKKNRKKVVQDRLLVVSKYRVFSIKRTKSGKKQIKREAHLFSLVEIFSDDLDSVELKFKEFKLLCLATNIGIDLPKILLNLFNKFGYTFSDKAYPKCVFLPEGRNPPLLDEVYLGICNGFIETYLAQCNFYAIPASSDVITGIEDMAGADNKKMKIGNFIGISNIQGEFSFSLVPVMAALRHNTYFTSFVSHEKSRKEVIPLLADAMLHNRTLTTIDVEGIEADEGWMQLGESFRHNPSNLIVELHLSNNPIGDKGAIALAAGLAQLDHSITVLKMANIKLTPVGAAAMFKSFGQTPTPFTNLEEINFSGNNLGGPGSNALADWLLKSNLTALKKIYLSQCQIELAGTLDAVRTALYAYVEILDVTGGRLEDYPTQLLVSYLGRATVLKELTCVGCGISGNNMAHLLNAIKGNENLSDLKLDLSANQLNTPENAINVFSKSLAESTHIKWIGLRDMNLSKNSLLTLATTVGVSTTLTEFDLSGNFKGTKDYFPALDSLVSSLNTHSSMVKLTIDGGIGTNVLGKAASFLFSALGEACALQELSIRGHGFGDDIAKDLFDILRWNVNLKIIDFDNNGIGPIGWLAAKRCLHANRTLTEIRYPKIDIAKYISAQKEKDKQFEWVRKLFRKIQIYTENNQTGVLDKRGPPFGKPEHSYVPIRKAKSTLLKESSRPNTMNLSEPSSPVLLPPPPPPISNGNGEGSIYMPAPIVEDNYAIYSPQPDEAHEEQEQQQLVE